MPRLDIRDVPPAQRHSRIKSAFAAMDSGETLELATDHDPKPLVYEFRSEVDGFHADGYEVRQAAPNEFVATFPKQ